MKISIPYTKIHQHILEEQAAGFAPFIRGYKSDCFKTSIITNDTNLRYDFHIKEVSAKAIISVLNIILKSTKSKPVYHLLIDIATIEKTLELTPILRSFLALISKHKTEDASYASFIFYIKGTNSKNSIIEYQFAEASQINYLITNSLEASILAFSSQKSTPIDPLYGSEILKTKIETLFTEVWDSLKKHFIT